MERKIYIDKRIRRGYLLLNDKENLRWGQQRLLYYAGIKGLVLHFFLEKKVDCNIETVDIISKYSIHQTYINHLLCVFDVTLLALNGENCYRKNTVGFLVFIFKVSMKNGYR